jgi:hypothetical protein
MNIFSSNTLWSILSGVIASFIFYLLTPWIRKIGITIVSRLSRINKRYSNSLYKKLPEATPSDFILPMIVLLPLVLLFSVITLRNVEYSKIQFESYANQWEIDKCTKELRDLNKNLQELDSSAKKGADSVISSNPQAFYKRQINKIEQEKAIYEIRLDEATNGANTHSVERVWLNTIFLFFTVVALFSIFLYAQSQFLIDLTLSFEKNMNIIRPIITDKEYHEFRQKWALISNEDDLKNLNNMLNPFLAKINIQ